MAKVKNKRNSGLADKVHNKKKNEINKKKLNPFEVHINREKLKVLGKKSKHDRGLPGVSRAKAIQKRKETLGTEMKLMHKTNAFIDRRIGEKDTQLSAEDRMIARFAAERQKQHSKKDIYNLADDEILTHRGQTLEQIEKFDDPRSDDEEDEEGRKFGGGLGDDFVAEGHFGGGMLSKTDSKDGAKSHKDLIEQLIAESKKRKAEKQKEKEQTLDLTEKLDSEWKDLQPVVFKKMKKDEKEESAIDKLLSQAEKKNFDYDKMMRELRFEKRGTPSDGLKTDEKQAKEERGRLEQLERERLERMLGEEERIVVKSQPTKAKHRSAEDLDDNFDLEDEKDFMLAYDKDGKPLVPENVLKDFSVPNAKPKFDDGISDTSEEDDNDNESDESESEELDDEKQNKDSSETNAINKTVQSSDSEEDSDSDTDMSSKNKSITKNKNTEESIINNKNINDSNKKLSLRDMSQLNSKNNKQENNSINGPNKKKQKSEHIADKHDSILFQKENDDDSEQESDEESIEGEETGEESEEDEEMDLNDLKDLKDSDVESVNDVLEEDGAKIEALFDLESDEGDKLKDLLTGKTPSQQSTALQNLIKSYDPGLAEKNKDKLSRLFAHMLQYVNDIFSNLNEESDILKSFLIFDKLAPYFYDLAHTNKVSTKKYVVELLKEKYGNFKKRQKRVPDMDTLIFFKLISLIYPTSDFRHPVTTPAIIFMSDILSSCKFNDAYSISRGLFITTLVLEYTILSKRLISPAINFLRGILYLSANTSVLNPIQVIPPFRLHRDAKLLNLENDCSKIEVQNKMAAKDLVLSEINDDFRIRCLWTSVGILKEFFDYFNDIEAQEYLFEPHLRLMDRIDLDLYPKKAVKVITSIVQYMKSSLEVKTFTPLCREKPRPKALRLYEPDIQEVFTGSKSSKLSREQAESQRLKSKLKKEMKGALREIRRDKSYIASVKIRQKIQR